MMPIDSRANSVQKGSPVERNMGYSILHLGIRRKYDQSTETVHMVITKSKGLC